MSEKITKINKVSESGSVIFRIIIHTISGRAWRVSSLARRAATSVSLTVQGWFKGGKQGGQSHSCAQFFF